MDISVLIVDDDKLVVDKLVEGVNWTQLGIGTVLTAYNIRQAMEILNEVSVDILLSDIREADWSCWNGYGIRKYL